MKKSWRKIVVGNRAYKWTLSGDCPCCSWGHILVHGDGASSCEVLHVDWHSFGQEIRPSNVRAAIEFGLKNGWEPDRQGQARHGPYIGRRNEEFFVLPQGIQFTAELELQERAT
ncbi:MAG: hypothetical protein ACSHYA_05350 [Opitutaceae bacterium]